MNHTLRKLRHSVLIKLIRPNKWYKERIVTGGIDYLSKCVVNLDYSTVSYLCVFFSVRFVFISVVLFTDATSEVSCKEYALQTVKKYKKLWGTLKDYEKHSPFTLCEYICEEKCSRLWMHDNVVGFSSTRNTIIFLMYKYDTSIV